MDNMKEDAMSEVMVSVIIPVYNEEQYITQCIESVLKQNVDFFVEIIVVNDASTDNTQEVVNVYQQRYPTQIKMLTNSENRGNGPSFYHGLCAAQGKYFHVLDADDYWLSADKLKSQVEFMEAHPDYVIVAHNTCIDNVKNKTQTALISVKNGAKFCKKQIRYSSLLMGECYFHTSSLLYRHIHQGNVPEFFNQFLADGEIIRNLVYGRYGKTHYLDKIWSVYRYTGKGIWSRRPTAEQNQMQYQRCTGLWMSLTPWPYKIYMWILGCHSLCQVLHDRYQKQKTVGLGICLALCRAHLTVLRWLTRPRKHFQYLWDNYFTK